MLAKILKTLGIVLLVLIAVVFTRTLLYKSRQIQVEPVAHVPVGDACLSHLSDAVKFRTVSEGAGRGIDSAAFTGLDTFLARTYPLATSALHRITINKLSLLYTWEGKNPNLKPVILIGHMDVVPAEGDGDKKWKREPFSGAIEGGSVWGRGTLDDKVNVIGILEAVEQLLKEGYQPERTIYLGFGHDEEIGGTSGAGKIAAYLKEKNVKAGFLLDEGLVITRGIVPGMGKDVALIGVAEKGYETIVLSVDLEGGHSSMPAKETPIGILASAVSRLEKHPMPAQLSEPVKQFLDYVGPEMPFLNKLAFANRWLLKPVIIKKYEASNAGNAVVRTTTAPTLFSSGTKENVLPGSARATINFRILPGETTDDVLEHVKNVIRDPRVKIKRLDHFSEPSPVSASSGPEFDCLQKSIKQIFPGTVTAPSLVIASTDARHYSEVAENLYRFVPMLATPADLSKIHGVDEEISSENFKDCIRFFRQLILNTKP